MKLNSLQWGVLFLITLDSRETFSAKFQTAWIRFSAGPSQRGVFLRTGYGTGQRGVVSALSRTAGESKTMMLSEQRKVEAIIVQTVPSRTLHCS